jgi:hypothetical protein
MYGTQLLSAVAILGVTLVNRHRRVAHAATLVDFSLVASITAKYVANAAEIVSAIR